MTATKRGTIQLASFALTILSSLILVASGASADDVSLQVSPQPTLYVGKFEPIERAPSGFGPLHALNADIRRMKADSNAARLSTAVTKELQNSGRTPIRCPLARPADRVQAG
jgi:hypothetical protein